MSVPNISSLYRRRLAALRLALIALLLAWLPLSAQTPPAAPKPEEEVVRLEQVVSLASRFNDRTVVEAAVPIDVFTAEEIRGTGYPEITQVLQTQVPSFVFPRTTGVAGTTLQRPAGLRGLSPDQTLVLINGKRRYASALVSTSGSFGRGSQAVDLNALPTQALGGVEVLRDGAAAQYGSDAIAGVINFQLRRDLGAELVTSYGEYFKGDGQTIDTSFNFGLPVGKEGGFLNTTLNYQTRESTKTEQNDPRQYYFGLNAAGQPVQWSTASVARPATPPAPATQYDPRELTVDRDRSRWGDPDSEARGIFVNSRVPLAHGITWYGFGGYNFRDASTYYLLILPGDPTNVRAIHPDGFVTRLHAEIADASFSSGLEGNWGEWAWDVSETWGRNAVDYWTHDTVNPSYGLNSPTSFYAGQLTFQQATTNVDLSRAFDVGLGHPVKLALGGEFRWENYTVAAGEDASWKDGGQLILDGPSAGRPAAVGSQGFPGFRPIDVTDEARRSYAAYVDLEHNLTDRWLVGLAGRAEEYSDAGSNVTGKLSTRFAFTPTLAVRGSVSTGFRAPSLGQSVYLKTQLFGATGTSGRASATVKTFPVNSAVARGLGAKELKPETSINQSFGVTFQPTVSLTFAVDVYQIEISDQITLSSNLLSLVNDPSLENYIVAKDPLARGVVGVNYFLNAIDSRARGLDLTSRYVVKPAAGHTLTFTLGLNLNRNQVTRIVATPPEVSLITNRAQAIFDASQRTLFEYGNPRVRGVGSVVYDLGKKWSFAARPAYYGQTSAVNANTGNTTQVFSANWVADVDVTYRFTPRLSLVVGANNVTDVYPDKIAGAIGGRQYDQNLSPFGWNGGYYYTRVNYQF